MGKLKHTFRHHGSSCTFSSYLIPYTVLPESAQFPPQILYNDSVTDFSSAFFAENIVNPCLHPYTSPNSDMHTCSMWLCPHLLHKRQSTIRFYILHSHLGSVSCHLSSRSGLSRRSIFVNILQRGRPTWKKRYSTYNHTGKRAGGHIINGECLEYTHGPLHPKIIIDIYLLNKMSKHQEAKRETLLFWWWEADWKNLY